MNVVLIVAAVVSLLSVAGWLVLLIWAAKGDGRIQREHERNNRV